MGLHKIKKGLSLPINGEPDQTNIEESRSIRRAAVLGADYIGMRPTLHVAEGDSVARGQLVFEDKKTPGVRFTAPAAGKITAINRGEKRVFQSLVIELSEPERGGRAGDEVSFSSHTGKHPNELSGDEVKELLLESGMWTALRARPYSRVANPEARPRSIFVTAMDSHPLAPSIDKILEGHQADFERGLAAVAKLTDGTVYVCAAPNSNVPVPGSGNFQREEFTGPHPAGTAGLHIHLVDPAGSGRIVWYLGTQDVVAIGKLFETGKLYVDRVVSLAGPSVERPRLIKTRLGASLDDLLEGEALAEGENRVVSGSVLHGKKAAGDVLGYLGRYHQQISVLREGRDREFLGWLGPGLNRFSVVRTYISKLMPGKKFDFTTDTNGSDRAIVPIGVYEKVFPFDMVPTYLLRSLVMHDVELAEELGCLELDEEDLGLCSFVCPGKTEYGPHLRQVLTTIEKEG
jgi:Na+-transporting NADH:ubiquinone oxidoreductase subunit A